MSVCTDEELLLCNSKTKKWSFDGMAVRAKCVKVYDGDTATFAFSPFPGSPPYIFSCRCARYNSGEIRTKNTDEKTKTIASRDHLKTRILDKLVTLKIGKNDKYGRPLVEIYSGRLNINNEMLRLGHGKPYDGTGEKKY